VKTHFTRIFRKLGVASRLELAQYINSRLNG
jgi:DNA-binding NarL/FixJ family response regulator